MKKTIATLALILSAGTAQADMLNPTHKSLVEDIYNLTAKLYVINRACDNRNLASDMLKVATNFAITSTRADEIDRAHIGIIWQTEEMQANMKFRKQIKSIENNPNHPKVKDICSLTASQTRAGIKSWSN